MADQQLTAAQQSAVNFKLANPAATRKAIAEHVGVSPATITNWKINNLVQEALADATAAVRTQIEDSLPEAVGVLIAQLDNEDARVAQAAAKLLIEHGLGKPKVTSATDLTSDGEALVVTGMDVSRFMQPPG